MSRTGKAAPAILRMLLIRFRFLLVFAAIGIVVANWDRILGITDGWFDSGDAPVPAAGEARWFCPMHPDVIRNEPSSCPACGMALSRRQAGASAPAPAGILSRVQLSPLRIRQAGVATAEVDYRPLVREIAAPGAIAFDERRITQVTARISGRVDAIHVNFKGDRVRPGDPLYQVFSLGPVNTQEEFLQLLRNQEKLQSQAQVDREAVARAVQAVDAARLRLRLWGISDAQVAELEKTRKSQAQITIYAPAKGVVIRKDILIGRQLQMGEVPYIIADDGEVWVEAEVFERDIGLVAIDQWAEIRGDGLAEQKIFGKVLFIEPVLDPATRTVKAYLSVENPEGKLRPGMYGTAFFWSPLGKVELLREPPPALAGAQKPAPATAPGRTIFVCDMHRQSISDKPGKCEKCGEMQLEARVLGDGSKLAFVCPNHPQARQDAPGACPVDGAPLEFRIIAETARPVECWMCAIHAGRTSPAKASCPDCGREMRYVRREERLAAPVSAVIDTGSGKRVFVDRGEGIFDALAIEVGPRSGEYYPVLSGLKKGDRVAAAGAFLLDAEANLLPGAASAYFGAAGRELHR